MCKRRLAHRIFQIADLLWDLGHAVDHSQASLAGAVNRDIDRVLRRRR